MTIAIPIVYALLMVTFMTGQEASAAATLQVKSPTYALVLTGDWRETPATDSEQRSFASAGRSAGLTVSALPLQVSKDKLELLAHKLIDLRLAAEKKATQGDGLQLAISAPIAVVRPWGFAVSYHGSESTRRRFAYWGAVTKSQALSIYVESTALDETELKAVLDGILAHLEFDKTP